MNLKLHVDEYLLQMSEYALNTHDILFALTLNGQTPVNSMLMPTTFLTYILYVYVCAYIYIYRNMYICIDIRTCAYVRI